MGKGAPAQLAGEGNVLVAVLTLVLGQVPRVLEGPLAVRAVERSLARVGELVSLDVGRAGEGFAARLAGVGVLSALRPRRGRILLAVGLLDAALPPAAFRKEFNRGEDLVRAGW